MMPKNTDGRKSLFYKTLSNNFLLKPKNSEIIQDQNKFIYSLYFSAFPFPTELTQQH